MTSSVLLKRSSEIKVLLSSSPLIGGARLGARPRAATSPVPAVWAGLMARELRLRSPRRLLADCSPTARCSSLASARRRE